MNEKPGFKEEDRVLLQSRAEMRSKVYMLLSMFYTERPRPELVMKLRSHEFISGLKNVMREDEGKINDAINIFEAFINSINDQSETDVAENLAVDFTRLFRGIKKGYGPPPPYESVYRGEDRVMGKWTEEVLKRYSEAGIGMDMLDELPDYIGIELKFLALLSYREAEAWKGNNIPAATKFLKYQQEFMDSHIHKWIPAFCSLVEEEARTSFYKGVALLTTGFIEIDKDQIEETLDFVNRGINF